MKRTRLIFTVVLLVLIAGFVVGVKLRSDTDSSDAQAATEASKDSGRSGRSGGLAGNRGAGPIAVVTAVVETRDVPITESGVGWVEPIASVAVKPRIDGAIVTRPVTEGQTVKAGDLLYRLDDKALQAMLAKDRATLAKDQASVEQLQADLERLTALQAHDYSTEQQVQQQQASIDEANASIAGDQAQIQADQVQLDYTSITAPIAGRVGVVNVTQGALVHEADQTPLLTITQMAPLRVSFAMPERDLDAFRQAIAAATPAKVRALDADTGKLLSTGKLSFIDSAVDTNSGTITVKADFDNSDGALWPGEYVRVEAELGVHPDATVVPIAAVQFNDKGSYVFLAKPDGTVATKSVTVTEESGDSAVIGSGVNPSDHVVVEGQLRLRDGAPIKETVVAADDAQPAGANVSLDGSP